MSNIFIAENGKIRTYEDVELVEDISKIRGNKDHWAVIDKLVEVWAKKAPDDVEAMQINLEQYREAQTDKKFGQTQGGGDQERRFTLSFPKTLMMMIRTQYNTDELPMDSKFYKEFAKRYPFFKVAQKV